MSKIRVNIKGFTKFQDVVHSPSPVYLSAEFWDKMNESFNLVDCDNRGPSISRTSGPGDLVHPKILSWCTERGKPFYIGEGVSKSAIFLR